MQDRFEEYNIIDTRADVSSKCEILKGINLTCVCLSVCDVRESGRSREAILPELKTFLSLHRTLDIK